MRLYLSLTQKLVALACMLALVLSLPTLTPAWLGAEPRLPQLLAMPPSQVAPNSLQVELQRTGPPRVNLNTASAHELEQLKGIGPALAQRIVAFRLAHGPFRAVGDLDNVKGIGPAKLELLRPCVCALPPKEPSQ